jgi:predicted nucleotidyltransferase
MLEEIKSKKGALEDIASEYGVKDIRIFGSVLRGEETPESDIDLLVKVEKGRSLMDLGGFQYYSSELLGRRVDVIMDDSIYHMLRDRILDEARPL